MKKINFLKIFIIIFLIILNFLVIIFYFNLIKEKFHQIIFLDVGQGSGTLIKTRGGKNILIDASFGSKINESLLKEINFFEKKLDLIFLTHYDRDHGGIVPFLMENFSVKLFLDSGIKILKGSHQNLFNEIKKKTLSRKIKKENILDGDFIFLEKDVKIKILFPYKIFDLEYMKSNNRSLVLQIFLGNKKILITGDLPQKYENLLVKKYGENLKSDILVAGHHGSKTSSSEIFLKTVNPEFFVISSGKNSYGHPTKEVLDSAKNLKLKILRTDKIGNVKFSIKDNLILEK